MHRKPSAAVKRLIGNSNLQGLAVKGSDANGAKCSGGRAGPKKKKNNHYIFSSQLSGLIRCLPPTGGPADVYALEIFLSTRQLTEQHQLCHPAT